MKMPCRQQKLVDDDYVENAIARLQTFAPRDAPYYVAFSGGKDSCCIAELCKLAGVKYELHYNAVGIDPPALTAFIREHYPQAEWHYPVKRFFSVMRHKQFPPLRQMRWCCEHLKETGGSGRVIVTGVRASESSRRAKRRVIELCMKDNSRRYCNPILDWTDDDVWAFILTRKLPYCALYDQGHKRIGCLMCPMATPAKRLRDAAENPQLVAAFKRNLQWLIDNRSARCAGRSDAFADGESYFAWWISQGRCASGDAEQQCFKFDQEPDEEDTDARS